MDPIGLAGGLNLYGFANGDPVNATDPFGLCPFTGSSESCIQLFANWAAKRGHTSLVNVAASANVLATALGNFVQLSLVGGGCGHSGFACGSGPAIGGVGNVEQGTVVIGKLGALKSVGAGERTLLSQLPDLGSEGANWAQNERVLLNEMSSGNPIRDASVDPETGALRDENGFLGRERGVLRREGWTYDQKTSMWSPGG